MQEGVRIVDEEQFGPVMPLIKYSDVDDAMHRANDTDFGLGGSVCKIAYRHSTFGVSLNVITSAVLLCRDKRPGERR